MMSTPISPAPLQRLNFSLPLSQGGRPKTVRVTTWGSELQQAKCTMFYFGGMPSSAEEPALHSIIMGNDIYKNRNIYLVCIDKPGVGGTDIDTSFQIRRDWPRVVKKIADELGVEKYGVFGISNGGPYVMACLTNQELRITAGAMIVGACDVWGSNYFSWRHPSGFFEGCFNSLPTFIAGPLIYLAVGFVASCLFTCGLWSRVVPVSLASSDGARDVIQRMLHDTMKNIGRGAALDCQQCLSPLYSLPGTSKTTQQPKIHNEEGECLGDRNNEQLCAADLYGQVKQPVALWYGTADSTVPTYVCDWLGKVLPISTTHFKDAGHGLYFQASNAEEVLDDLMNKMESSSTTK